MSKKKPDVGKKDPRIKLPKVKLAIHQLLGQSTNGCLTRVHLKQLLENQHNKVTEVGHLLKLMERKGELIMVGYGANRKPIGKNIRETLSRSLIQQMEAEQNPVAVAILTDKQNETRARAWYADVIITAAVAAAEAAAKLKGLEVLEQEQANEAKLSMSEFSPGAGTTEVREHSAGNETEERGNDVQENDKGYRVVDRRSVDLQRNTLPASRKPGAHVDGDELVLEGNPGRAEAGKPKDNLRSGEDSRTVFDRPGD